MTQNSAETGLPKIAFSPLVDLAVRIADTVARLRRVPGRG